MRAGELVKRTITRFVLKCKKKDGEVLTYYKGTKKRFLALVRACSGEEYAISIRYTGGYKNETPFYKTKREAINAIMAFTERNLLEEFLEENKR